MLERLYRNHVLVNLTFVLVLVIGTLSYLMLPREQDPTVNFNWIVITTLMPGAAASDVERRLTDPLEDAVRKIADIKFVSSNSRESVSMILVRFEDISSQVFDKRLADLRREIQNKEEELPDAAEDPVLLEITSSNAYPTATLVVTAQSDDENLRYQASNILNDLERLPGVDRVEIMGLDDPELQVLFHSDRLEALGIAPSQVADTVAAYFQDLAAGSARVAGEDWLVRVLGTSSDPGQLSRLPLVGVAGEVPLGTVADVIRAREKATTEASFGQHPAVVFSVMKEEGANILELLGRVRDYIDAKNVHSDLIGVRLVLVDDQTVPTRVALNIMQRNAMLGLLFVLMVTWLFLGARIALLVTIGIPFVLTGTFWMLSGLGETLNVMVLLGIVISLGMLVDDAVVVVEAIYYRIVRGEEALQAAVSALREVFAPVTTAILTTMAAFLPLMLLPGILGEFMRVIPLVVTIALAISLLEAYWILPVHVAASGFSYRRPSRFQARRERVIRWIRLRYVRTLLKVLRYPKTTFLALMLLFVATTGIAFTDWIKKDFFASDPIRKFFVNVQMPPSTALPETLRKVVEIENKVHDYLQEGEARAVVSYAGQMFTETAPMIGDFYGQILVGLNPHQNGMRSVDEIMDSMREAVSATPGPVSISFLRIAGGPPTSKPISVKVRGDHYEEIRAAADALQEILENTEGVKDVTDDASRGRMELQLQLQTDAVRRAGLNPVEVRRVLRLLADGEVAASMQHLGEELDVRIRSADSRFEAAEQILDINLPTSEGGMIRLRDLFVVEKKRGLNNIRHYNFRRAITVEADIDKQRTDTVTANRLLMEGWEKIAARYPNIDLDFSGELDDIQESMDAIVVLFAFGIGLIYLIIGTQFRSYFQPLMIIMTVPMAFVGVVMGLLITQNPLSLFTLYGVVALAGIAVNAAIVLISAANARLAQGMSVLHAIVYAARRRVIPILITSLTTIAGLFSLASGLGGKSLVWGPVATAIVWGLAFSTVLTLLVIPLLYRLSMAWAVKRRQQQGRDALSHQ